MQAGLLGEIFIRYEQEATRGRMGSFSLEIPDDILDEARIPPSERASVLRRELSVQLYARDILPKAAARRLSGMDRLSFDDLLAQRGIVSRLTAKDLNDDLNSLAALDRRADDSDDVLK